MNKIVLAGVLLMASCSAGKLPADRAVNSRSMEIGTVRPLPDGSWQLTYTLVVEGGVFTRRETALPAHSVTLANCTATVKEEI